MMASPQAFAAVSQQSAAVATLAANPKALSALAAQPNVAALMANPRAMVTIPAYVSPKYGRSLMRLHSPIP